MWKKVSAGTVGALHLWRMLTNCHVSTASSSPPSAVDSLLLRSLKEHYIEVSKMTPPPKISPHSPFTVVKGAFDKNSPVLKRNYGDEKISISVMRLANIVPFGGCDDGDGDDLFLHVDISKPGVKDSLHFLCGLYPEAIEIHSVSFGSTLQISQFLAVPTKYNGPAFQNLNENTKDALHFYIEERGVNESLFRFLQAWLYVKDHQNLMRWFKTVATFINNPKPA